MPTRNQLGTLLLERGLVTEEQLDTALEEQRQSRKSLGRVLIDAGVVSESDLVSTLAARIGLEFVDLLEYSIDPSAVGLISDSLARRFQAV
ncbi:MAG: type II secretion system protein GspE, partial [Acidimicrobiia bacterium]|nr:type II secretion system protein GspE [Acidimicrobiia bacterium]